MTERDLSQLYYISKEIKALQQELAELRQKNFFKPNIISDMPKGGERKEPTSDYVNELIELEGLIDLSLRKLQRERRKIEEFIDTIADSDIRLIIRLRAINNMNWESIGAELGMERTTASKKYYRYLRGK